MLKKMTGLAMMIVPALAAAHHSFAMFDMQQTTTFTGTVKSFEWTNPHSWLDVVADDGKNTVWGIEMGGPSALYRSGFREGTLKPGDKIKVEVHPLKDGSAGASLVKLTLADGRVMGAMPGPPPGAPKPGAGSTAGSTR